MIYKPCTVPKRKNPKIISRFQMCLTNKLLYDNGLIFYLDDVAALNLTLDFSQMLNNVKLLI